MKILNKIVAALLIVITVFTGQPEVFAETSKQVVSVAKSMAAASDKENSDIETFKNSDDFNDELIALVSQNKPSFSELYINVKENTISNDSQEAKELSEYGIDYSKVSANDPVMPVVAVLNEMGVDAVYDKNTNEVVTYESGNEARYSFSNKNMPIFIGNDNVSNEDTAYMSFDEAIEEFGLKSSYKDGIISMSSTFQTKRLIVQTKSGKKINETFNAQKSITNGKGYYVFQYDTIIDTKNAYEHFSESRNIEYVVADEIVKATAEYERTGARTVQSDRYKKYLSNNGKNAKIVVAVIDTGADTKHEMIKDRIVPGKNLDNNSNNIADGHGHGTHVSGIIADNTNSNVKIMPIKVLDDTGHGSDSTVALGIDYAVEHKANVINMSLGGDCVDDNCPVSMAIKRAIKKGVSVVAAAGNDSKDTEYACPARIKECVTVAASNNYGNYIASFSNYGDAVDLAAPGWYIQSAKAGGGYVTMSGTSMAAPFISAAAALLLTQDTGLTPSQIEAKLKEYTSDILIKGRDKFSGNGVLNFGVFFGEKIPAKNISIHSSKISMYHFYGSSEYYPSIDVSSGSNGKIATDRSFSFEFSNPSIASFDSVKIKGLKAGKTKLILKTSAGATASTEISVLGKEVWLDYAAKEYAGGDGSKENPYIISNAKELAKFALDRRKGNMFKNKYLNITQDIDLSGKEWVTATYIYNGFNIGDKMFFCGHLDGKNHKIKNMSVLKIDIDQSWGFSSTQITRGNNGFIGYTSNATVKNLGLENVYCPNAHSAPLIFDAVSNTTVSNCYVTGFSAYNGMFCSVGGDDFKISNCFSSCTVLNNGIVDSIYSVSLPDPTTITNTFFCGKILGNERTDDVAGFVNIAESYFETNKIRIINCFTAADSSAVTRFVKQNRDAAFSGCYCLDSDICTAKNNKLQAATGISNKLFKTKSFYTDISNWDSSAKWDFKNTWAISPDINNGYPYLKNMKPSPIAEAEDIDTWKNYKADSYAGGKGSKEEPYLISTPQQLAKLTDAYRFGGGKDMYFKLTNDIDLGEHAWLPIGCGYEYSAKEINKDPIPYAFRGNIDGNGHKIKNLRFSKEYKGRVAFILDYEFGSIRNLEFVDAEVEKGSSAIVAGRLGPYGKIENCIVRGILKCYSSAGVTISVDSTAAISGVSSYVECDLNGVSVAGFVFTNHGTISRCAYCGHDTPMIYRQNSGKMLDCFSLNSTLADMYEGGEIIRCYSAKDGKERLYQGDEFNFNRSIGASKENLKDASFFVGWDFEKIWNIDENINEGYPYLRKFDDFSTELQLPTQNWRDIADKNLPGEGTKEMPYLISTPEQLAGALQLITDDSYFRLINDIDLSGRIWPSEYLPYATYTKFYFDGNNKTVRNMTTCNGSGLFGTNIYLTGEISNLNIENIIGNSCCALIWGNNGVIRNCHVKANVSTLVCRGKQKEEGDYYPVGGISVEGNGSIIRCSFNGNVTGSKNAGGITSSNAATVIDCSFSGIINGSASVDTISKNSAVKNCISIGKNISKSGKNEAIIDKKSKSYFPGYDFENVWDIDKNVNNGFPFLRRTISQKITYVLNGGKNPTYADNDYIPGVEKSLPTPEKVGYAFGGWYRDKKLTQKVETVGENDTKPLTLYAKWVDGYVVKFVSTTTNKKVMNDIACPLGKTVRLPKNKFSYEYGKFAGWSTSKNGKVNYTDMANIKDLGKKGETITLYAVWEKEYFLIKYKVGVDISETLLQEVYLDDENRTFQYPPVQRQGYYVAGWSLTPNGKIDYRPGEKIKGKINNKSVVVLYAVWEKIKTFKIIFDPNGGTGKIKPVLYSDYPINNGKLQNSFTRKNYRFMGWSTEKNGKVVYKDGTEFYKIKCNSSSITLYAVWSANKYTISFKPNGGSGNMKTRTVEFEKTFTLPQNEFKAPKGYKFVGWSTSNNSIAEYKNKAQVKNLATNHGEKIVLYAVWGKAMNIKFDLNGGKGKMSNVTIVNCQNLPKFTPPKAKGMHFEGWAKKKKSNRVDYKNGGNFNPYDYGTKTSITLYAVWKKYDYVVKFDANGGSGKTESIYFKRNEERAIENSFKAPKGKHFVGWATSKNGKVKYDGEYFVKNVTKKKSITLYAVWEPNKYTIKFNANGGTGAMKNCKAVYGKELALPKNTFKAPKGKSFAGWSTSKNGKVVYKNRQSVKNLSSKNNAKITLYAVWKKVNK